MNSNVLFVLAVREELCVWLDHPSDHHELWSIESTSLKMLDRPVFQPTEQPVLPTSRPGRADFEVATHAAVHRFPLAASAEAGRRGISDSLKNRRQM